MTGISHLEAFAKAFDRPPDDDLTVVRYEVRIGVYLHYPSRTVSLKVHVGMRRPRTFQLTATDGHLELRWGKTTLKGDRLLVLAEKLEGSSLGLHDGSRALVRLLRQVDGHPSYQQSFKLM